MKDDCDQNNKGHLEVGCDDPAWNCASWDLDNGGQWGYGGDSYQQNSNKDANGDKHPCLNEKKSEEKQDFLENKFLQKVDVPDIDLDQNQKQKPEEPEILNENIIRKLDTNPQDLAQATRSPMKSHKGS